MRKRHHREKREKEEREGKRSQRKEKIVEIREGSRLIHDYIFSIRCPASTMVMFSR